MSFPSNIHPVDELAAIRAEIKGLEAREALLRADLLATNDDGREGIEWRAFIQASTRETLDKAALMAALGRDNLEPFLKKTEIRTLKLAKREG